MATVSEPLPLVAATSVFTRVWLEASTIASCGVQAVKKAVNKARAIISLIVFIVKNFRVRQVFIIILV